MPNVVGGANVIAHNYLRARKMFDSVGEITPEANLIPNESSYLPSHDACLQAEIKR